MFLGYIMLQLSCSYSIWYSTYNVNSFYTRCVLFLY